MLAVLQKTNFGKVSSIQSIGFATIFCFLLGAFFSTESEASLGKSKGLGLYLSVTANALYGKSGSENASLIPSRNMAVYGGGGALGLTYNGLFVGGCYDYNLWRQLTDPAQLGKSNTQGNELSQSLALGYDFGPFSILGKYILNSSYNLEAKTSRSQTSSFQSPASSYALQLRFPFSNYRTFWGLHYTHLSYSEISVEGKTTAIANGKRFFANAYGLLFGIGI